MPFLLIAYDIKDDKRRTKAHKRLKDFGQAIQFSVFLCDVDRKRRSTILNELYHIIDSKKDKVHIFEICQKCKKHCKALGRGQLPEENDLFFV